MTPPDRNAADRNAADRNADDRAAETTSSGEAPHFAAWPLFEGDEIAAAGEVLASGKVNYWTGPHGRAFESEYAAFTGSKYAVAASNGTTALEMALHGVGLKCGEEVIVPSRTFIATAAAVYARGGHPVCADVDHDSGNITAETILDQITERTRGIIVVHLAGWPCEMDAILDVAAEHGLFVIEDCAQAHGAEYHGRPVGSLGDAGCFSFCQDKILTTAGEGGMLVTDRQDVFERAWTLKDHGKHPDTMFNPQPVRPASEGGAGYRWLVDAFGSNMRLTEMQSAIGRIVLGKLPAWVRTRRRHAAVLAAACRDAGLRVPMVPMHVRHARYKFYAHVEPTALAAGWNRDRLVEAIRERGVPCFSGSCSEIYRERAFPQAWKPDSPLPVAQELGETSVMLLCHHTLSAAAVDYAATVVRDVMAEARVRPLRAAA